MHSLHCMRKPVWQPENSTDEFPTTTHRSGTGSSQAVKRSMGKRSKWIDESIWCHTEYPNWIYLEMEWPPTGVGVSVFSLRIGYRSQKRIYLEKDTLSLWEYTLWWSTSFRRKDQNWNQGVKLVSLASSFGCGHPPFYRIFIYAWSIVRKGLHALLAFLSLCAALIIWHIAVSFGK